MSETKRKSVQVGTYLVSKNGQKYLKFEPRKGKGAPDVSPFPLTINEGDVLFLDWIEEEAREKFNIPDFIKARINKPNSSDDGF